MFRNAGDSRVATLQEICIAMGLLLFAAESAFATNKASGNEAFRQRAECDAARAEWTGAINAANRESGNPAKAAAVRDSFNKASRAGCVDFASGKSDDRQYVLRLAHSIRSDERCRGYQISLLNVASKAEQFVDPKSTAQGQFQKAKTSGCA